jgi:hypothetical protein
MVPNLAEASAESEILTTEADTEAVSLSQFLFPTIISQLFGVNELKRCSM